MRLFVTTAVLLTVGFIGGCASHGGAPRHDAGLRHELLAMCEADQKVPQGFGSRMSAETVAEVQAVDARHTSRMRAIVAEHGWPGRSLVGDDGSHAAWSLVQHADSAFMAQCLPLMKRAVAVRLPPQSKTEIGDRPFPAHVWPRIFMDRALAANC
jgi:hypothetical protein